MQAAPTLTKEDTVTPELTPALAKAVQPHLVNWLHHNPPALDPIDTCPESAKQLLDLRTHRSIVKCVMRYNYFTRIDSSRATSLTYDHVWRDVWDDHLQSGVAEGNHSHYQATAQHLWSEFVATATILLLTPAPRSRRR